jgi:endonuclease/exonuclease/phosphatase family metal-dependent hydrolase
MNYYFAKAIDVPNGGPYGNALLSKYKIVSAETIPVPDPAPEGRVKGGYYETRCLLKAKLENGFTVLVIHFGLNPDEQRNAADTVLQNIEDERCILMGDFNVTPEKELLDPIRERMTDTADYFEKDLKSFPSDDPKWKIDYMFISRDLAVKEADIPAITVSDHCPYTLEIK